MQRFLSFLAVGLIGFATASSAHAATIALTFTGGSTFLTFDGTAMTIGWRFQTNASVVVTDLGAWDAGGDGFGGRPEVGLWDSAGTLLASTSVPAGVVAPLTNGFRFQSIAPVALSSGEVYVLGLLVGPGLSDVYSQFASSVATDPAITFIGDTRNNSAAGFSFPSTFTGNAGRFGPNMMITVPEPATLLLVGAGIAATGLRRRIARRGQTHHTPTVS